MKRKPKRRSQRQPMSPEAALEKTLDALQRKHVRGVPLKTYQKELLRQNRPALFGETGTDVVCTTFEKMASLIAEHFKTDCLEHYISWWMKGEHLPSGCPNFPQRDPVTKRFNVPECFAWYQMHKIPKTGEVTQEQADLFESDRVDKIKRAQERRDFERFEEAKARGEYVRLDAVIGYAAGSARQLTVHYDKLIEDKEGLRASVQEAAKELGLTEEQRLKLDVLVAAAFLKSNSALKAKFKKVASVLGEKIEALKEGK